ncbi:MAG: alpha/beta hydrolase [Nocardiopsaceae bacterium]|jgi:3-oxoadipate enol-lactonase|nr:alpha/beta hydrolase [Nocardiopsaceae bacterium]
MPTVRANGIDLHYRIDGAGDQTVLMINGVGDDLEGWAFQRDDFASAGMRVVAFDNRGCGRSSQPAGPYTSAEMARDAKGLANALELAPFHLVGVSMGGVIAQEYAAAWPDDLVSVVLASTYAKPDPLTYAAFEVWALIAKTAGMPVMMKQQAPWVFSSGFYAGQPDRLGEFLSEMEHTTQPAEGFAAQIGALLTHDCTARLAKITMPALVMASEDDIIIKPALSRAMYEALPAPRWALLPGGHAAFLEDPPAWNRTVIDFINTHRAQPAPQGGAG